MLKVGKANVPLHGNCSYFATYFFTVLKKIAV